MAAVSPSTPKSCSHVETVTDWEDEADKEEAKTPSSANRPSIRQAAAFLRSSFNASARFLRLGSTTERSATRAAPGKASSRESNGNFVGTLLTGIVNAVGLGRETSPIRDVSPSEGSAGRNSRSKLMTSPSRNLARLSSAAMMRAELQNYSQFGDLRNDSFSSPAATKLRRRSSLVNRAAELPPAPAAKVSPSRNGDGPTPGALYRQSCPGPILTTFPSTRVSAPGYAGHDGGSSIVLLAPSGGSVVSPREVRASPWGAQPTPPRKAPSCQDADLSPLPCRSQQACSMPALPSPIALQPPHPPPPNPRVDGPALGAGASPAASRPGSAERLPPMARLGSVRDRPPTPRAARNSYTGSSPPSKISKVLGSFRLPDILTGGPGGTVAPTSKSVTERRSSVTGALTMLASFGRFNAPDISTRSQRSSVSGCGGVGGVLSVRPSGGSFLGAGGSPILGPGGAAISASAAKRAAAAAAAANAAAAAAAASATASPAAAPGPAAAVAVVAPHVLPSGTSITSRANSSTSKPIGGILQDFQSSLEHDEEGALAAVNAEFDRRFGRVSPAPAPAPGAPAHAHASGGAPGPMDPVAPSRQPRDLHGQGQLQGQGQAHTGQGQAHPQGFLQAPRPPSSERSAPQPCPRRRSALCHSTGSGGVGMGVGGGSGAIVPPGGSPDTHYPQPHSQRHHRASCSAALLTSGGSADNVVENVLFSSFDSPNSPGPTCPGPLNAKMRLASIRLSYADGIMAPGAAPRGSLTGGPLSGSHVFPIPHGVSDPQPPAEALPPGASFRRKSAELYVRPAVAT